MATGGDREVNDSGHMFGGGAGGGDGNDYTRWKKELHERTIVGQRSGTLRLHIRLIAGEGIDGEVLAAKI